MAKIKIIVENTAFQTLVKAEHGLSILIENNIGEKLLFDTGQTSTIIHNLEIYNQKPEEINAIALSHGHYDHSGGLPHVLSRNHSANVYAKRECLLDKRRIDGSYIGAPQLSDNQKNRLVFIDEPTELITDIYAMPNITIYDDTDTHFRNMRLWKNDILKEDTFDDEMFLVLRTNEGLVIISGCAHRGICNMIASAKTYFNQPILATIGGFHTIRESEEKVVSLANKLNGFGIKRIYTCHCTGIDKYLILKSTCNAEVNYASTGDVITIE